jgi:hypothetical protein
MGWFGRHKILTGVLVLVVLVIIGAALGGGGENGDGPNATTAPEAPSENRLYPGRADAQREDQERAIGGAAEVNDVAATVKTGGFQQSIGEFQDAGYIVADVELRNVGSDTRPYNILDWRLQTPSGQVKDFGFEGFTGEGNTLESGDIVGGGSVSGKVIFDVGSTKGDYYLIWKPDPYDAARGIWKVTI